LPAEVITKNKWVVKGYGDFHHDAANISFNDLPYLAELLKKEGYDQRIEELPFIKKLVSANIQPIGDNLNAPAPYVIREVTLKRGSAGKKIRVGITGFTDLKPSTMGTKENAYAGFQINDPFQAAQIIIPELKQKADIIIALAYMDQAAAQNLATQNPDIDTVVGAKQLNSQEEAQHFNRATIVFAFNQTKYLGELRYYINSDGRVENQIRRFIELDSTIPDDPKALETVTSAHDEFTNEQNKNAQKTSAATKPASLINLNSPYAGAETCAPCHQQEFEVWEKSGHAHAISTLERKRQQFDNECVGCHVVGFQKAGGFQSLVTTPQLANVQCEACHGPGRQHSENPVKGYGYMPTPAGCAVCHTVANSPDFNFATYWPKIKHGQSDAPKSGT
jgi:hypothetical protein